MAILSWSSLFDSLKEIVALEQDFLIEKSIFYQKKKEKKPQKN